MVRGGRSYSSARGSYRGSSRGNSYGGGYGSRRPRDKYSSFESSYDDGGSKYGSDRYSRMDEFSKPYRMDSYSPRERHSPERKRPRTDGPSSRHDSYGGSRYESSSYPERSSSSRYSGGGGDHHEPRHFSSSTPYTTSSSRRSGGDEFRRPPPPPSLRGGKGRLSSRGPRGMRRERGGMPPRRRMADRSYAIRKPRGGHMFSRPSEYTRRPKLGMRMRSTIRRRRAISSEKESSGDEEIEKIKEVKKEKADVSEGDKEEHEGEEKDEDEQMDTTEEGDAKKDKSKEKKEKTEDDTDKKKTSTYIKLVCPQCNVRVSTFRRYEAHLQGRTHMIAMRRAAAKQRSILSQMRHAQRNAQNEHEKIGEDVTDHTVFCPLCKLNYKQERKVHQASAAHRNMKKFLMPFCKVCKVTFKSPMVYENHLCSIEHIKRKQRSEATSDVEEDNLDEFTTIDSVGEIDENIGSNEEAEKEEKDKTDNVSVGIEQIKRIECYYCDLCRMFLPRGTENEYPDILAGHCRKRFHMQRYVRQKEIEELKKRAEKLQRKETAEKEKKKDDSKTEPEDGDASTTEKDASKSEDAKGGDETKEGDSASKAADDDKLWEAVDKDLGELLEETDVNKSDDDDDEESRVNGERFDRFKSAEKEKKAEEAKGAKGIEKKVEKTEDSVDTKTKTEEKK